jgi:hypothetical protein
MSSPQHRYELLTNESPSLDRDLHQDSAAEKLTSTLA